jgi:hypothetical protein
VPGKKTCVPSAKLMVKAASFDREEK